MTGLKRAVASVGGIGHAPVLPGTIASAAAVLAAWLLHWVGSFPLLALATGLATALGLWAAEKGTGGVVIDDVAGQWLALWPLSGGLWWMGAAPQVFPWPGWLGGFLLFRLLVAAKPWLVGRVARSGGAAGAMGAALLAGLLTALAMAVSAALAHGLLL